jgi:uncharacterized pyridoxamine 5'-phosphate oxidase family protein
MNNNTIMQDYTRILDNTKRLAIATSVDQIPNVRIVNFVYEAARPEILYFTSNRHNRKVAEFALNNQVAVTTVPEDDGSVHVRSNQAFVQKSKHGIDELKELFITKIPGYDEALAVIGDKLDVFEIHLKKAAVVTGIKEPAILQF